MSNDLQTIEAVTEARAAVSFERTISIRQYEPIKVWGSVSFAASTPKDQVQAVLALVDEYGAILAEQVINLAQARADALGASAAPAPQAPRQRAATQQRKPNPTVDIVGRAVESYTNKEGEAALKGFCDVCQAPAYFNPYESRNKQKVTAQQSLENMLKYDGGVFCRNHKPAKGNNQPAARPQYQAPAPVEDEPF